MTLKYIFRIQIPEEWINILAKDLGGADVLIKELFRPHLEPTADLDEIVVEQLVGPNREKK